MTLKKFVDSDTETWYPYKKEVSMDAYCVKCKAKKEMKNAKSVTMKNGRPAMKGVCPDCGTGLYRILTKAK